MTISVDSNLFLSSVSKKERTPTQSLGKDEFLKILMTQLQNQDPMKPMEDKEFISQMATFSSLEQMTNLNSTMKSFIDFQKKSSITNFSNFIGKDISWEKIIEDNDGSILETLTGTGVVNSIDGRGTEPKLTLSDGTSVAISEIKMVESSKNNQLESNTLLNASQLIGKLVSWNSNGQENESMVESVQLKEGKVNYSLTNGEIISSGDIIKISSAS